MLKTQCPWLAPLANSEKYTFWLEGIRRSDRATVFCCLNVPGIQDFILAAGFTEERMVNTFGVCRSYSMNSDLLGFLVIDVVDSVVVRTKTKQLMKTIEECSEEELFDELYNFRTEEFPKDVT